VARDEGLDLSQGDAQRRANGEAALIYGHREAPAVTLLQSVGDDAHA